MPPDGYYDWLLSAAQELSASTNLKDAAQGRAWEDLLTPEKKDPINITPDTELIEYTENRNE